MQNQKLDNLLSDQSDNLKLQEELKLLNPRTSVGSLAAYDGFNFDEMHRFMRSFHLDVDETITGKEPFPGEMMKPKRFNVDLPEEICDHLIKYYKNAYNLNFTSFTEYVSSGQVKLRNSNWQIIVQP